MFLFRLYWPELLDHCFWTQMLNEEEGLNEEQLEEENEEENNSFEEDGPTSLRFLLYIYLSILLRLYSIL